MSDRTPGAADRSPLFSFVVVAAIGVPRDALIEAAGADTGVLGCEANLTLERFESRRGALRVVREQGGIGIFLAKILDRSGGANQRNDVQSLRCATTPDRLFAPDRGGCRDPVPVMQ